jgi:hypothetical protein
MSTAYARPVETTTPRAIVSLLAPTLGWDKSWDLVSVAMRKLGLLDGDLTFPEAYDVLDTLALEAGIVGVTARFARSRVVASQSFEPRKEPAAPAPRKPAPTASGFDRAEGPFSVGLQVTAAGMHVAPSPASAERAPSSVRAPGSSGGGHRPRVQSAVIEAPPSSSGRAHQSLDTAPPSSRVRPPLSQPRGPTLAMREIAPLLAHTMGEEKGMEAIVWGVRRLGLPDDRLDREQAVTLFELLAQQEGLVGITARFAKARLHLKFGA